MFGARGLEAVLTAADRSEDLLAELGRRLDAFTGADGARDDRSVLLLPLANLTSSLPEGQEPSAEPQSASDVTSRATGGWYFAVGVRGNTLKEAELAPIINGLFGQMGLSGEQADRAHVCVTELINNAIDHGILGLDSSLKQTPDGFEAYFRERRKRLRALRDGVIVIRTHLDQLDDAWHLRVAVSDSGEGFGAAPLRDGANRAPLFAGTASNPDSVRHGRGIHLVRRLADRLAFHDDGATAEFHITVTTPTAAAGPGSPSSGN